MAYNNFTLDEVIRQFDLILTDSPFCEALPFAEPDPEFLAIFQRWLPLGQKARSEKAKSERLISPILLEVEHLTKERIRLFSGEEFNVDRELGLNGFCDFLLCRAATPYLIQAPVAIVVEAKRGDLGFGQCVAEMVAAKMFNEREGKNASTVYGCVTSGKVWQFLKLDGKEVVVDGNEYLVAPVEKILGILKWMVDPGDL
jgi:hypothetical protein